MREGGRRGRRKRRRRRGRQRKRENEYMATHKNKIKETMHVMGRAVQLYLCSVLLLRIILEKQP